MSQGSVQLMIDRGTEDPLLSAGIVKIGNKVIGIALNATKIIRSSMEIKDVVNCLRVDKDEDLEIETDLNQKEG